MVYFTRGDISTCHFTSTKPGSGKKPQVIARFVSRQSIREIYQNKKKLKSSPIHKAVFITDDVTPLRLRLKSVVSNIPGVERTFFRDGNVHCIYNKKHYKLMSPDDIFDVLKVEITPDMLRVLGLNDFV